MFRLIFKYHMSEAKTKTIREKELSNQSTFCRIWALRYLSYRRNILLRSSLTCSSSSVTSSLDTRLISSTTLCCMARHVRFSSWMERHVDRLMHGGRGHRKQKSGEDPTAQAQTPGTMCWKILQMSTCFKNKYPSPRWGYLLDYSKVFCKNVEKDLHNDCNWQQFVSNKPNVWGWHEYLSGFGQRLGSAWVPVTLANCQVREFHFSLTAFQTATGVKTWHITPPGGHTPPW